ncbi:hypothetical protein Trydic_g2051 [Trypoxylus dichotomus]
MAVATIKIVETLCELSEYEGLRVSMVESAKGALIAGSCAFVGGLVGGPVGLGVGGVIGAVTGAIKGRGKFKSVAHVLMYDMTPEQQERLASSLVRTFRNVGLNDMLIVLSMVMSTESVKSRYNLIAIYVSAILYETFIMKSPRRIHAFNYQVGVSTLALGNRRCCIIYMRCEVLTGVKTHTEILDDSTTFDYLSVKRIIGLKWFLLLSVGHYIRHLI